MSSVPSMAPRSRHELVQAHGKQECAKNACFKRRLPFIMEQKHHASAEQSQNSENHERQCKSGNPGLGFVVNISGGRGMKRILAVKLRISDACGAIEAPPR